MVGVRTDAWRSAYGNWLSALRPASIGLAFGPDPARDAELWTAPISSLGPGPPAGRAVVVADAGSEVVQVALDA